MPSPEQSAELLLGHGRRNCKAWGAQETRELPCKVLASRPHSYRGRPDAACGAGQVEAADHSVGEGEGHRGRGRY